MSKPRHIFVVIDLQWTMQHHHGIFAGIYRYAEERGWKTTIWPHAPADLKSFFAHHHFDGIIGRITESLADEARRSRIPMVNVWQSSPATDVPMVISDTHRAGWNAAEHLLARGIKRLGFLGTRSPACRSLFAGFREAAEIAGGSVQKLFVPHSYSDSTDSWESFYQRLIPWIREWKPPFGVFTGNDAMARYIANAAAAEGLNVPGDVAIVGSGNEDVACLSPAPSLSSIDFGHERAGCRAAQLLHELMEGGEEPTGPILVPPAELAARASTDAFPVDDEIVARALRFMADESHRPIKVSDVVAHTHASHRSLVRHFQAVRGRTIVEELTRMRIGRVKRQLVESDLPIKEIASSCGFTSSNRLCENFRVAEGLTPGEYRIRHAKANKANKASS